MDGGGELLADRGQEILFIHLISPRETLAFRPARDKDRRGLACLPRPAFLDVCQGVMCAAKFHPVKATLLDKTSAGVLKSRVCRGLWFKRMAISLSRSWL